MILERDTSESEGETAEETLKYPEIEVLIERVNVRGLMNTGSPVSCISEEFYKENQQEFDTCPKLPIVGQVIKGAIGNKSSRLKLQIMAKTRIDTENRSIIYLVMPRLVRDCILGIDTLQEFNFTINLQEEKIIMKAIEGETHLQYFGGLWKIENIKEKEVLKIEEVDEDFAEDFSEDEDTEEEGTAFEEGIPHNQTWNRFQSLPEI